MSSANRKAPPGDETGGATTHEIADERRIITDTEDSTVLVSKGTPPKALLDAKRWIRWKSVTDDTNGKTKKVPIGRGSWNEPSAWKAYDDVTNGKHSVGFVLGEGIGGIDLDACRDPGTGALTNWANRWIDAFDSYVEVSPSGTGVKIFAKGAPSSLPAHVLNMDGEPIDGKRPQVEAYVDGRWFAYTGDALDDTPRPIVEAPEAWAELAKALEPTKAKRDRDYAGRNDALFRHGCRLRERGADNDEIAASLDEANRSQDIELHENFADGPIDEGELKTIIDQVCAYPTGRDELVEMNEKHAFIHHWGSTPKVLSWRYDVAMKRNVAVPQTMADIRARYDNKHVTVGDKAIGLGTYWLKHPLRREYDSICFAPEEDRPNELNLWQGFGVEPRDGDWSRIRGHLRYRIACGDEQSFNYILRWLAWSVQNPGEPAEVALVLRGGRGTGKGMLARAVMRVFGQHAIQVSNPNQVSGGFNAHHEDCALMFADEAVAPSQKKAREDLKRMITEPTLFIERKGIDPYPVKNRLKVLMASNDDWVVPAGPDERRFAVFDVADRGDYDSGYFKELVAEIDGEGPAAMLHELRAMDLDDWHPRYDIPQTKALQEQKALALRPVEVGVRELLVDGGAPARHGTTIEGDRLVIPTNAIIDLVRKLTGAKVNGNHIQPLLEKRLGITKDKILGRNAYWFPPLVEARAQWDRAMAPDSWDNSDRWTTYDEEPF